MRANHVLKFIGQADIDEEYKKTVLAEARFLRALAYYNLIRMFGDVPLITDVQSPEQYYSEREKVENIYDFILDDLESNNVVESLPLSWEGVNIGRATTGAARMLLAHIYMTRAGHRIDSQSGASKEIDGSSSQNWQKAHDYAKSIIGLGRYALWTDEDAANQSYISYVPERVENKDNVKTGYEINFWTENDPESIFEIQYVSWWPGRWDAGNLLQEGSNINAFDWNLASGVEEHGYSNNLPLPGFVNSYEAGDKRKTATVLGPGDTIWLKQYTEDMEPFYVHDGYLSPAAEREGFEGVWLCKKWLYGRTDERESSPRNMIVWRYAEVYLILAETLNEMGQTSEAYQYINVIRNRAGLTDLQTGLTKEEFRDAVFEERKFELAYEGNRWFDAIRSKKLIEWVKADRNVPVAQKHYLLPIDQAAIETNPSLYQNWGY